MNKEHFTRRNLPHWYVPGAAHFVTFRLDGTLPVKVLNELTAQRNLLLATKLGPGETVQWHRQKVHKLLFAKYDSYLDRGEGNCHLADPRIAAQMRSSLYYLHDNLKRYHLISYCIMPNHVHAVFIPTGVADVRDRDDMPVGELDDSLSPVTKIMHSLKSFTAHVMNEILNREGTFWQRESYDHWVRDRDELERIVQYITMNPVKAGLVQRPEEWLFGACRDRYLIDGDCSGWLKWDVEHASRVFD